MNIIGQNKQEVLQGIEKHISSLGFTVVKKDFNRPWGGFLVIDEAQEEKFGKLSPKILIVEAGKRLSWQYHHRRSEIWKVIGGKVGVVTSQTDEEGPVQHLGIGEVIQLAQGQRHRLVGLNEWGVLAEIWQHINPAHPSDEDDIVRVQDDFGR
jgi:mannose-6-phosphate isomerase-like protein (cupin superfamily)